MILGLDMGGTHIDAVIIKDNKVIKKVKKTVDFNNVFNSILETILMLLENVNKNEITKVNLSTTISTNAIVENKINRVGLIIQSGPGLSKDYLFNNKDTFYISGYIDHRGVIVKKYLDEEINKAIKYFVSEDIKDVAIISKFSTRNYNVENAIKAKLSDNFNVSVGHLMSGELNFPRRINTTYLNAAVKETFNTFIIAIKKAFNNLGLNVAINILKADGGVININNAKELPVQTILSGPAASLMGMIALNDIKEDAILIDIGGTTTDIFFLAGGDSLFEPQGIEINKYKTLVRAIYSKSIGLGGDSFINLINNELLIGPTRKDKPLALGGKYLTPTDALVALDRLVIGNKDNSIKGLIKYSNILGFKVNELANKIISIFVNKIKNKVDELLNEINNKVVYTIKEILQNKILIPKKVIVIGGAASALSMTIEEIFNLPVIIPKNFEVANAIGAALTKTTSEINLLANTETNKLTIPELNMEEEISKSFNLNNAIDLAIKTIKDYNIKLGGSDDVEVDIVEANSFNMVSGFYTKGVNIRVKAQIKPGLDRRLNYES